MPKISKPSTKKTAAKAKKVAAVTKKTVKEIKKIKRQLKFQKHIFQKILKNICVISTYLFLR